MMPQPPQPPSAPLPTTQQTGSSGLQSATPAAAAVTQNRSQSSSLQYGGKLKDLTLHCGVLKWEGLKDLLEKSAFSQVMGTGISKESGL